MDIEYNRLVIIQSFILVFPPRYFVDDSEEVMYKVCSACSVNIFVLTIEPITLLVC